jgi:NADH-quinone oxidoreductase subunit M
MLNLVIFLPLLFGLAVLALPRTWVRPVALAGALLTLLAALVLWAGYDPAGPALQWRTTLPWIPSLNAQYDVAVNGVSLPLLLLTTLLSTLVMVFVLPERGVMEKAHAFLFLLMETGLLGLFAAQDLLLFYVFFEVGLVPMYFIIGIWGHERRRYAAIKFFLYTRAGSLAMLLAFLGLYLAVEPHTFSLPALVEAQPLEGGAAALALLGMMVGFGVKLPIVPLHNWLPDAHVEAPTEGSVILAGLLLKMGGYGMVQVMLPTLPEAAQRYGWALLLVAIITLVYGALAALGQSDLKRLVAYTSVNHMGYVILSVAIWALASDPGVRQLALNGATLQMVSHGLLTGGMFFMVGILQHQAGTREMDRFGGLLGRTPLFSGLLLLLALGSLGLPGLSGFVAEFQAIGAAVGVSLAAAALAVLSLLITTGLYIRVLVNVVMGEEPDDMPPLHDLDGRQLAAVAPLAALSLLIGILPATVLNVVNATTRLLAQGG